VGTWDLISFHVLFRTSAKQSNDTWNLIQTRHSAGLLVRIPSSGGKRLAGKRAVSGRIEPGLGN
jgi:hypothetical protein